MGKAESTSVYSLGGICTAPRMRSEAATQSRIVPRLGVGSSGSSSQSSYHLAVMPWVSQFPSLDYGFSSEKAADRKTANPTLPTLNTLTSAGVMRVNELRAMKSQPLHKMNTWLSPRQGQKDSPIHWEASPFTVSGHGGTLEQSLHNCHSSYSALSWPKLISPIGLWPWILLVFKPDYRHQKWNITPIFLPGN